MNSNRITIGSLRMLGWALGLLLLALPVTLQAQFNHMVFGDTVAITGYTGPGGDVAIPDTISGLPVTTIWTWAFIDNISLTSVFIPSSVIDIHDEAFGGNANLTAFQVEPANPAYTSLDGVLYSKDQTKLISCPGGQSGSYTIPDSVTIIGVRAFQGCAGLTSVIIGNSVYEIPGRFLEKWMPPIGAFADCRSLTDITIPDSVGIIGTGAFIRCDSLARVVIGSGVEDVGIRAFSGCTNLTSIDVAPSNPSYRSLDGVLFYERFETALSLYPPGRTGPYTIPDTVTSIGYEAFEGSTRLTSVTIGDSVRSIQLGAFSYCTSLISVHFTGGAPVLGGGVFSGATNATVYRLPATTGWGPTFADRPTALWIPITPSLPSVGTDSPLRLVTHSPAPATVRVQRSVNLVDWEEWQTVSRDAGPSELLDTETGTGPYRFYRGIEE